MCYSPIIYLLLYLPQYFSIHKRGGDSYGLVQDTRLGCSSTVAVLLQLRITDAYCYFSFFASSCRTRGGWVALSGGYCGPRTSRQHPLMREYMMGLNTYPPTKENMWWYTSYTSIHSLHLSIMRTIIHTYRYYNRKAYDTHVLWVSGYRA
jgi:hypothetical protein